MRIVLVLALALMLAGPALAANVLRDGYQEAVPQDYTDQHGRGTYAVVNCLDNTFTDLCTPIYRWAFPNEATCYFDPQGAWGLQYDAVLLTTAEMWWPYEFGADLATAGSYLDAGGCFMLFGQDFLWGAGGAGINFVTQRMCMTGVIEDVLWDSFSIMQWAGQGPLDGLAGSMPVCFFATANGWFTDDVSSNDPIGTWTCDGYTGGAGSACNNGLFSTLEFACDEDNVDAVIGAVLNWCGDPVPVDESTWGAIKNTWR